jgi:glycosyltransferase involved in cell wall biosynthesis
MLDSKCDVSLVIACYNEAVVLEESIRQIIQILDNSRWTYEIIFVDDCSQDNTRDIIDKLVAQYKNKNFRKLFHKRNMGRGRTVADGFRIARGDTLICYCRRRWN